MSGDLPRAIGYWESIAMIMPGSPEVDMALADLNFRNGEYDKAETYAESLSEKLAEGTEQPGAREMRSSVELLLGTIFLAQGKAKDGVARWTKSMEIDPNFALANSAFIGRAVWPGLIEAAKAVAKTDDQRKAVSLVGSLVKEETKQPAAAAKSDGASEDKKGRSWFSRGKK
jgi:tetratricopeptide (TPR) repeat protein